MQRIIFSLGKRFFEKKNQPRIKYKETTINKGSVFSFLWKYNKIKKKKIIMDSQRTPAPAPAEWCAATWQCAI